MYSSKWPDVHCSLLDTKSGRIIDYNGPLVTLNTSSLFFCLISFIKLVLIKVKNSIAQGQHESQSSTQDF